MYCFKKTNDLMAQFMLGKILTTIHAKKHVCQGFFLNYFGFIKKG